jgi:hypothetical protein
MIYALVEPSIYMIASILPTTRHLYRRIRRKAQRSSGLRNSKRNDAPRHDSAFPQSAELAHVGKDGHGIQRDVDIWQMNTTQNSSQEELTLGEWYHNRQQWNRSRPVDIEACSDKSRGIAKR